MISKNVGPRMLSVLALAGALLMTIACGGETIVVKETVVETVIVKEQVNVPGQTVVETVVIKERVNVPGQTIVQTVVVVATSAPTATAPEGPQGTAIVANGPLAGYPQAADNGYGHTGDKAFLSHVYDYLIEANPDLSLAPGLASKWSLDPDLLTWNFTLRQGVKFHNGEELTAADAVLQAQRNADTPEAGGMWRTRVVENGVVQTGDYTFKIITKQPLPSLPFELSRVSFGGFFISPKSIISRYMDGPFQEAVGTGPYRLTERRVGELHRLVALDPKADWSHWRHVPDFKQIDILPVAENSTRIALLRTQSVDVIDIPLSLKRQVEAVEDVQFVSAKGVATVGMLMCCIGAPDNVWNDIKVRQAMNLSVDWDTIIDKIFAGEAQRVPTYPFATFGEGFDPSLQPYAYDPDKARELLAEAGYPNGFDFTMRLRPYSGVPDILDMGEAIATMWEGIGVRSTLKPVEGGVDSRLNRTHDSEQHNTIVTARATFFPIGIHGSITCHDPDQNRTHTMSGRHTCAAEDDLIDEARATVDVAARLALAKRVNQFLHGEYATVGAIEVNLIYALGPKIKSWQPLNGHTYLNRLEYLIRR